MKKICSFYSIYVIYLIINAIVVPYKAVIITKKRIKTATCRRVFFLEKTEVPFSDQSRHIAEIFQVLNIKNNIREQLQGFFRRLYIRTYLR